MNIASEMAQQLMGPTQAAILRAMQNRPMYRGTVPIPEKKRRRAANKRARAARRTNR